MVRWRGGEEGREVGLEEGGMEGGGEVPVRSCLHAGYKLISSALRGLCKPWFNRTAQCHGDACTKAEKTVCINTAAEKNMLLRFLGNAGEGMERARARPSRASINDSYCVLFFPRLRCDENRNNQVQ